MMKIVLKDITIFLLILFCIIIGFAQGFWLLNNSQFHSSQDAYYTTFLYLFDEIHTLEINPNVKTFDKIFQSIFLIIIFIFLLNFLIALMSNSLNKMKDDMKLYYWKDVSALMTDQGIVISLVLGMWSSMVSSTRIDDNQWIYVEKDVSNYIKDMKSDLLKSSELHESTKVLLSTNYDAFTVINDDIIDRTTTLRSTRHVSNDFLCYFPIWDYLHSKHYINKSNDNRDVIVSL